MVYDIIERNYTIKDLPDVPYDEALTKKHLTSIKNAWRQGTFIDGLGKVWIKVEKLHTLLRTTKPNIKYYVAKLNSREKQTKDLKECITGTAFIEILDRNLQEKVGREAGKTRSYMRYSEELYRAIRDSDQAEVLRYKFNEMLQSKKKELKKKRIEDYSIVIDELTGEDLEKRKAEFSHIRSCAIFPSMTLQIMNGLIVNKSTHDMITDCGINDEEELLELCEEEGWDTVWYGDYIDFLREIA